MSKYTTEVRFICEHYAGLDESEGFGNVADIIEKSREKIFSFDFPMYDESYRSVIETKILKHYYTREIGFETVGLWRLWLDKRLNEIMPYYNKLYESETHDFDPFYDVNYSTTRSDKGTHDETTTNIGESNNVRTDALKEETTGSTETETNATRTDNLAQHSSGSTSSTQYDLYSDTPQGGLSGVNNENYLTTARKITDTGTTTTDGTNTGTINNMGTQNISTSDATENTGTQTNEGNTTNNGTKNFTDTNEYIEHIAGKRNGASYSQLLQEYRDTFLNIDMRIINDLSDLFMNVW